MRQGDWICGQCRTHQFAKNAQCRDCSTRKPGLASKKKSTVPVKPYYAVLDFEANCSSEQDEDHEIIEFPVVLCNSRTGEIVSEFRQFVQLVTHEHLSDFIKNLTHITDEQVKSAPTWSECITLLNMWCHEHDVSVENTTVVTCGDWDLKTMLPRQLKLTKTTLPYTLDRLFSEWSNMKKPFKRVMKHKERVSFVKMMDHLNLEITGHHHSGIDDCRNIAKICHQLTTRGANMTNPNCKKVTKFVEC